jgi:CelD/BcsL family acetyltransferase involved in cellulose biosynthesis
VERARIPHPFLRHEWVRTWWDAFGSKRELHIVVMRDANGAIAGIAPLMRESATQYGLPVRRLALLANDHTPRTDFIITGSDTAAFEDTCRVIWDALAAEMDQWDVLQLTQLERTSPTLAVMARFAAEQNLATGTWNSTASPYLSLGGTWDEYWNSLPAKFRSNVRNRISRLVKIGEPVLEVLEDPADIDAACADAWRLEKSGWKDEEGTSITSDPAVETFYTLLAERATERGWLRLLFLTVGGRRIAMSYSGIYDGRLFLFKTGYDREFHQCSPFKVLTYLATQDAYARGLREVDFLGDTEPWKEEWTDAARGHDWLFIFSSSRRARLLHMAKFQMAPELRKWRT